MAQINGLPGWFRESRDESCLISGKSAKKSFADKTLDNVYEFLEDVLSSGAVAGRAGLLQSLTPQARISGIVLFAVATALSTRTVTLGIMLMLAFFITALSKVPPRMIIRRIGAPFVFSFIIVAPVLLDIFTPGAELVGLQIGSRHLAITATGAKTVGFFVVRASAMVWFTALLVLTTESADFFRGLQRLPVPPFISTVLFMTFRYMFILVQVVEDVVLARRSRVLVPGHGAEAKGWLASRITLVLRKSIFIAEEVGMAMASRGFNGVLKTPEGRHMIWRDFIWVGFAVFVLIISLTEHML